MSTNVPGSFNLHCYIDFELHCVNKTHPPSLNRKEQQKRPAQDFEVNYLPLFGELQTF